MQLLSIGVSNNDSFITAQLQKEYNKIDNSNISLLVKSINGSNTRYIVCDMKDSASQKANIIESIRMATINILTDYIISEYEEKMLSRIISTNYCYFNLAEKKEILQIALKNLANVNTENVLNELYFIRRKNTIIRKLIEFLDDNNEINIEGFVNFRLQEYMNELESIVDKAVDDYLMEREYKEFIKLLKYFVEVQEPKLEVIHIVVNKTSGYSLLDESHKEITNQCIREFMQEIREGELNYDDLLVSSLITLAPKKIVIHGPDNMKNKELFDTIKNVFNGKVSTCYKCEVCDSKKELVLQKNPH